MAKAIRSALLAALVAAMTLVPLTRADSPTIQDNTKTQSTQQADAAAQAQKAGTPPAAAVIRAGTQVTAELQSTLDTRNAKPNDEVVARVKKDVKQDGRTVLQKGDRLAGRITEVQASTAAEAGARLAIAFDRVVRGEAVSQLNAVVTAVLSVPSRAPVSSEPLEPPPMAAPPMSAPPAASGDRSSSGGGLLGGVTSTVNSTVSSAGSIAAPAAGQVAGNAAGTLDSATRANGTGSAGVLLPTPRRMIQLDSQAQAEHQSSTTSVFSSRKGDLRLESGTRLQFRVAGSADSQARN